MGVDRQSRMGLIYLELCHISHFFKMSHKEEHLSLQLDSCVFCAISSVTVAAYSLFLRNLLCIAFRSMLFVCVFLMLFYFVCILCC